jgi:hypothetical protein
MSKETTPYNKIQWMMEFKEEGLTGFKSLEFMAAARLPEIDLIYSRDFGKKFKPVVVSNTDKGSQPNLPFFYDESTRGTLFLV